MRRTCKGQGFRKAAMAANGAKRMGAVRGSRKSWRKLVALGVIAAAALTWSHAIDRAGAGERRGGGAIISELSEVQKVRVTLNKSRTFKVERPFATIVA